MATLSKPLISAAALASAAAVAVATPAIVPSMGAPTTAALSTAKVNLTDFATLLTLTPEDYVNTFFSGYGFTISPNQAVDVDWAAAFVGTGCDFSCSVVGGSGIAYMVLDALINGNTPFTPEEEVKVNALNYTFEGNWGSGVQYLVTQPFGDPKSPLYNPAIANGIALAFQGAYAGTILYVDALSNIAKLAQTNIPLVGPYIYGAINAYLGPNTQDEFFGDYGYYAGLSGILKYALDVITTGGNPYPPYGPPVMPITESAASTLAAAVAPAAVAPAAAAVAETVSVADSKPADTTPVKPAAAEVGESAPEVEAPKSAPADEATETAPEVEAPKSAPEVEAPEVEAKPVETPAVVDVPAADVATSAPTQAPAKPSRPRPIKDAVEKVGKQINDAVNAAKAKSKAGIAKAAAGDKDASE